MENPGDPKISLPPRGGETARSSGHRCWPWLFAHAAGKQFVGPLLPPDNLDQRSDGRVAASNRITQSWGRCALQLVRDRSPVTRDNPVADFNKTRRRFLRGIHSVSIN